MQFGLAPAAPDWQLVLASGVAGWGIAFLAAWGIGRLFSLLLRQEALGFGDVKYLAAVGAWTGLEGALWTLLIGVFAGSLLGLGNVVRVACLTARRRRARGSRLAYSRSALALGYSVGRLIPFGPPLILGTTLVLLAPMSVHHFLLVTWPQWIAGASPFVQTTTTP
jgi:prepilin signal peptidase PulO-like enzyme (type II secretory pathway)